MASKQTGSKGRKSGGKQREDTMVPLDDGEAAHFIKRLGELGRAMALIKSQAEDEIAKLQDEASRKIENVGIEVDNLFDGLSDYAQANRARLTGDDTKIAKFGTGTLGWRNDPPSVKVSKGKLEKVIAWIEHHKLEKFLRRSVELNKKAILDDPKSVEGNEWLKVKEGDEQFFVKPADLDIEFFNDGRNKTAKKGKRSKKLKA